VEVADVEDVETPPPLLGDEGDDEALWKKGISSLPSGKINTIVKRIQSKQVR